MQSVRTTASVAEPSSRGRNEAIAARNCGRSTPTARTASGTAFQLSRLKRRAQRAHFIGRPWALPAEPAVVKTVEAGVIVNIQKVENLVALPAPGGDNCLESPRPHQLRFVHHNGYP